MDLTGNGINITPLSSSNFFIDAADDGHQQRVAWAGAGNGMLVYDPSSGPITQANQFQFTLWDPSATTDMEALEHVFDGNHDSVLNASDSSWSSFRILVTNADGTTTLKTLAEAGVTSINLQASAYSQTLSDGSSIDGKTTFTRIDGTTGTVATAKLASGGVDYRVQQTVTANGDGSTTIANNAYDLSGVLDETIVTTTSADGRTRTILSDWDGNGIVDQTQTDVTTVSAGVTTQTITNVDGSGTLLDETTTTTSADRRTVTIARDTTGAGYTDSLEVDNTKSDGSSTVAVSHLTRDGSLISRTLSTVTSNGLGRTLAVDSTGSGYDDLIESERTSVAGNGTRTKTITDSNADGSMRSRTMTVTSADGLSITRSSDAAGNGIYNLVTTDTTVVNADGSRTTSHIERSANGATLGQVQTTISADGGTTTKRIDNTGNGTFDLVQSDAISTNAAGTRVETISSVAVDGSTYAKEKSVHYADGLTGSVSTYQEVGATLILSQQETRTLNGAGALVDKVISYNPDGTVNGRTITTTSADGLTSTLQIDPTGTGTYTSTTRTVTTKNAAGDAVTTQTLTSANATVFGTTVTTASADGSSSVIKKDSTGSGVFDTIISHTKTGNPDGTVGEVVETTGADGTLLGRTTTVTSADHSVVKTTTENGDDETVQIVTATTAANGTVIVTTADYAPNATLIDRTVKTTSANGLSITTQSDDAGTGTGFNATTTDVTVINANGSRTQTVSDTSGNGTLIDRTITTTSANGLTTVQTTNVDGKVDYTTTDATSLNNDGSTTERVTLADASGGIINAVETTVSGNGLSTITETDANGDGVTDVRTTDVTVRNNDGSRTETVTSVNGTNGSLRSKSTTLLSASGDYSVVSRDTAGRGFYDQVETVATLTTGAVTDTVASYGSAGQLLAQTVTTTGISTDPGINGVSKTTATDINGDGVADRTVTVTKSYGNSGSTTVTTASKSGTADVGSTVQTTSANGLTVTTTNYGAANNTLGSSTDVKALNADGSTTETVSRYSSSGALQGRTITTISADGKTTTVRNRTDGTSQDASKSTSVLQADGSVVTTILSYSTSGPTIGAVTSKTVTTTAANGLSSSLTIDKDGNGVTDDTQTDATVLNADGSKVETVTDLVAGGASNITIVTNTSANGLARTVATTGAIMSVSDNNTLTDTTVINNDGSKTETRTIAGTNWGALPLAWSKEIIQTSATGLSTITTLSAATDSTVDTRREVVTAVDGSVTATTTLLQRDGSALQTDVLTTSASTLTSLLQSKRNGSTSFNHFETKATNGDGSLTDTIWDTNAGGATTYKLISTSSANGLSKTVKVMPTDGTTVGSTTEDITTLNADGTAADAVSIYNGTGQLRSKSVRTTSADGLSITTTADANGDGQTDETTTDVTVINADGSKSETITTNYATGAQKSQTVVATSANGLSVTTNTVVNAYTKLTDVKTTASNGVQTETVSRYRADGTTLASSVVTTTSADGNLTIVTQRNATGAVTQTETTTVQAGAFGSYDWRLQSGNGAVPSKATHFYDANGVDRVSVTVNGGVYRATLTKEQEDDLQAKVGRMYVTVLGRTASHADREAAFQDYSTSGLNLLSLTTRTVTSTEFSQKYGALTAAQFIEQMYRNALGRGASLSEMSTWLAPVASGATTRAAFAMAIAEGSEHVTEGNVSQETNNTYSPDGVWSLSRPADTFTAATTVGSIYRATLGIAANDIQLSTFTTPLLNGTNTEAQIVAAVMSGSDLGSLANSAFVNRVFLNGLNRQPSEAEAQLWTSQLAAGYISRGDFILAIAKSPDTGNVTDNPNGTETRLVYGVSSSDEWQSQSQIWQKAKTETSNPPTVTSHDWVTTQVLVSEGGQSFDQEGNSYLVPPVYETRIVQQDQTHNHSVVTQTDSKEVSVTTVASDGTSTVTSVSNSLGDEPWKQIVLTYEGGQLLDTITTSDSGVRSIAINRATGADVIAGTATDTLRFTAGISYNQLWFNRSGNDLVITVIDQAETITLGNWYVGSANRPASIVSGDGYSLTYNGIESLRQSMAGQPLPRNVTNGVSLVSAPTLSLAQDTSTNKAVTSNGQVNVAGLLAGHAWQYSLNGGTTWTTGSNASIAAAAFGADGAKTVQVRQADDRGNYSPTRSLSFTLDTTATAPTLALATDTSGNRNITSNGLVNVFGLGLDGTWQYSVDGGTWTAGSGTTIAASALGADGAKSVRVRQTDVAGNVSATRTLTFTLDTSVAAPTASLAQDTSGGSGVTSVALVNIAGLVTEAVWEYSMDGGQSWAVGSGSSIGTAAFGADGLKTLEIRQTDVAGNVSPVTTLTFTLATASVAPILELVQDTSHGQGFTSNGQINISRLAAGGSWEYSLNGGTTWLAGTGTSVASTALGTDGAKTVKVRQTDAAGNVSAISTLSFTLDTAAVPPTLALANDTSNGKLTTSNGRVNVTGVATGATWQYSLDGGETWVAGSGTSVSPTVFGLDGYKSVQVRQTDVAGNTSLPASLSFTLAHGTPIYAFGEAIGETINIGDGKEQRIEFNTSRTGGWAYTAEEWLRETTSTTNPPPISSMDWVTSGGMVSDGNGGSYDERHVDQLTVWHSHSVVTQHDSVEQSVTTAYTDGTTSKVSIANSLGDHAWTEYVKTYENGILLDTVTTNDDGTRSIKVNRSTGADNVTAGNSDTITFAADISHSQLWFNRVGNNLAMTVVGQTETLTLTNWYTSTANHPGAIVAGDGFTINDSGVQAMVQAMTSLAPSISGELNLRWETLSQLEPQLAANWHHS